MKEAGEFRQQEFTKEKKKEKEEQEKRRQNKDIWYEQLT